MQPCLPRPYAPTHNAAPSLMLTLVVQGGVGAVIQAAGALRERGVLPSLQAVHVAGYVPRGRPVPRPDAAPDISVVLLGEGRQLPRGQYSDGFESVLVTDDILDDVQTALAVPRSWDWDKPAWRFPDEEARQRMEDDHRSQFGNDELFAGIAEVGDERASDDGSQESSKEQSERCDGVSVA